MKKVLTVFLLLLTTANLCSCGNPKTSYKEEFLKYYEDDFAENRYELSNSGYEVFLFDVGKEDTDHNPHIIVDLMLSEKDNAKKDRIMYEWMHSSEEDKIADLKEVANKYIDFSKSKGWDNDYYLYVTLYSTSIGQWVYDYEQDYIIYPEEWEFFSDLYEEFHSMNRYDLAETDDGKEYMIDKGVAYLKHNELEWTSEFTLATGATVYITSDGKFHH